MPSSVAPSLHEAMEAWDKLSTDVSKTASAVASLFPESETIPSANETDSSATMPSLDAAVDGVPDISEVAPVAKPWQQSMEFEQLCSSVASHARQSEFKQADSAITAFATTHHLAAPLVAAETLQADLGPFQFEDQYTTRIDYLTLWTGRSLLMGDLSTAKQLLVISHATAKQAESDALLTQVRDWQKSLDTMSRLGEMSEHAELDSLTPVQKYAVGRYWALVRRDWSKGLPYLCSSSDPLVSKLAVQETLLGPGTPVAELISIAEAYLTLAEKNKGWLHDSYVLHADELLLAVNDKLSSSDQLQLTRYKADLAKRFGDVFDQAKQLKIEPKE